MKFKVSANLDNNYGDDEMLTMLAKKLSKHSLYVNPGRENLHMIPFEKLENVYKYEKTNHFKKDFDGYIKLCGGITPFDGSISSIIKTLMRIGLLAVYKLKKMNVIYIQTSTGNAHRGLGNRRTLVEKLLTKALLLFVDEITVRHKSIFKELRKLGVKKVKYYPDMVFSEVNNYDDPVKDSLGISVYRSIRNKKYNLDYLNKMVEIIDLYTTTTEGKVKLFAFDTAIENDLWMANLIYSKIKDKSKVEIISHLSDSERFTKELITCHTMIGVRFHSIVVAIREKIPVLPIIYAEKTKSTLDDLNYNGKRIYLNNIKDENAEEIVNLLNNERDKINIYASEEYLLEANGHLAIFDKYNKG
ncbi:polysaccharide pyruvyl transferase family protein [Halobacillus fulvus]|nr:polysaccharide pyruvyl transferase family protein [Halobacillus fulvus]